MDWIRPPYINSKSKAIPSASSSLFPPSGCSIFRPVQRGKKKKVGWDKQGQKQPTRENRSQLLHIHEQFVGSLIRKTWNWWINRGGSVSSLVDGKIRATGCRCKARLMVSWFFVGKCRQQRLMYNTWKNIRLLQNKCIFAYIISLGNVLCACYFNTILLYD